MEELIELVLVVITDNVTRVGLNFLNNVKNNMIHKFRSIKWIFHELEEVKERIGYFES